MNYRVPTPPMVTVDEMRSRIRDERRYQRKRGHLNFMAAIAVVCMTGWGYAQLARLMGFPPSIIGATAVFFQFVAGICAWAADLGQWLADQWRKDMPIHFTKKADRPADRVYIKGLLYVVAIMIIAAAAFYGQEEIKAIWRDVGDIISGWGK
jgi:hypothetical protein